MLLDTSFLVDLMNAEESAVEEFEDLRESGRSLLVPPGVLFELHTSIGSEEEEKLEELRENVPGVGLHPDIEIEAARVRTKLEEEGRPISEVDYLIAGTAKVLDQRILTADDHFEDIEGVEVENYR